MEKNKFTANKRQDKKVNQLRREGLIPANLYQAGKPSIALELKQIEFSKFVRHVSDNAVLYLKIDDQKTEVPVMLDELQHDVMGKNILHVVFRKVNLSEKIKAEIPIEVTGEFAVDNAVFVLAKNIVEVEALPTDLPEKFVIDQSLLKNIGDQVFLSSLNFDHSKVSVILNEGETVNNVVVALIQEKAAEEAVEESAEFVEPEVVGKSKEEQTEAVEATAS